MLKNLLKGPSCSKKSEKPTAIDHILTNHPRCYLHSGFYETGLSDFQRLTLTLIWVGGGWVILPPPPVVGFPLITQEQ